MTKRLQSKYSVCKRLKSRYRYFYKNLWGISEKNCYRSIQKNKKRKRITLFGKLLNIKQAFKFFYSNVNELTFKKHIECSVLSSSKTMNKLSSLMESRLDCVLFRSCLVRSFLQARQLINHRLVLVNGLIVRNSNIKLIKGDLVKLGFKEYNSKLFNQIIWSRSIPNHLEIDFIRLSFIFLWDRKKESCYYPVRLKYRKIFRYYK